MKIALPTNDGVTISEHFGRSASFLIFEIENGQIMGQRAAEALRTCGTQILVAPPASAEETVVAYLAGKLTPQTERFCQCQH